MPTIDLHERRAVVTGAAKGIGRTIAARLLTAGAAVCLWDRAPEALTSTTHDLTALGTVEAVTVDVTDPAAVSAAVQATRERLGGLDILVNNASSLSILGKGAQFPRVICIFALLCSHYKICLY